eukprot:TRINITY_DN4287_c0_g1_i1.p1 TRINITY_DN4287_c0_g1~~TRINITY_DN4287_c0_g1_i1.p1  ORF type:complete len:409 (+),score=42.12 TRINITY_DN4287_c0_g1_i1:31-1257(+)
MKGRRFIPIWLSRDVFCLLACCFLDGFSIIQPFLALCFERAGLGVSAVPYVFLVASTVTILLEVPSGALADLWGRAPTLRLARFLRLLSFSVLWIWYCPAGALVYTVCHGAAMAMASGTGSALLYDWMVVDGTAEKHYHLATSLCGMCYEIGACLGSLLGALMVHGREDNSALMRRIVGYNTWPLIIALALEVFVLREAPQSGNKSSLSVKAVFAQTLSGVHEALHHNGLRPLLWLTVVIGACGELTHYMEAIIMRDAVGLPLTALPAVNIAVFAASAIGHALSTFVAHAIGRKPTILLTSVLIPAMCAGALIPGLSTWLAIALFVAPAVLWGVRNPIFDTATQNQAPSTLRATIGSVFSLAQQAGTACGSPVVSLLTWSIGVRGAFATLNVFYLVSVPFILARAHLA